MPLQLISSVFLYNCQDARISRNVTHFKIKGVYYKLTVLHIANKIATPMRKMLRRQYIQCNLDVPKSLLMAKSVLSILNETTIVVFVSTVQLNGLSEQAAAGYHSKRFCPMTRSSAMCVCCKVTTHLWRIHVLLMEKQK